MRYYCNNCKLEVVDHSPNIVRVACPICRQDNSNCKTWEVLSMDKKTVCSIQLFHNALDRLKEKHLTEDAWDQFVDEVETIIKEAVEG